MNFLEFYGLKEDPFRLSPDPVYFYPSRSHQVALDSLDYTVEQKEGFCLISGEPGTGKTTLLKVFIDKWKERASIALILTPRLGPEEFLQALLEELNVECADIGTGTGTGKGKINMLKAFRDFLLEMSERKRPVVIIVDEAQELPDETLEELRLLSNLETEKEKLLQIILVGQPEIEGRLSASSLRQLDQRINVRARVVPLTAGEITAYINHRLIRAGKGFLRLDDKMVRMIKGFSMGVPRIINVITSRTIMAAYLEGQNVVTARHVRYAIDHLDSDRPARRLRRAPVIYGAVAVIFFCIALVLGYLVAFRGGPEPEAASVHGASAGVVEPAPQLELAGGEAISMRSTPAKP